jgi:hypothetical protein
MITVFQGSPVTVNVSAGYDVSTSTEGTLLVEAVSGGPGTGATLAAAAHGANTYGPWSSDGVVRLTASGRNGGYEVAPATTNANFGEQGGSIASLVDGAGIPRQFGQVAAATCTLLGDSRMDQQSSAAVNSLGIGRTKGANHFLNWYNALNNQPLKVTSKFAVSGSLTSDLNGQITNLLASSTSLALPQFAFIWSGINDLVAVPAVTAAVCAANVTAACNRLLGYGITPVVFLDTGSTSLNSAAKLQSLFEYNQRLRDTVDANRRILMFDPTATVWDATASTWASTPIVTFKSGYVAADGVHMINIGSYNLAVAFGAWFSGRVAPLDTRIATQGEMVNANNPLAYIVNPLFTTTTGGAVAGSGGLTGNVPGSWTLYKGAVASTATTITTPAGAYGNDLTLAITTAAADVVHVYQDVAAPVRSATAIGTILQEGFEIDIASGTNFTGVEIKQEWNDGTSTYTYYDLYCPGGTDGNGPQGPYTVYGSPNPMTITAVPSGWITCRVTFRFSGAGGVTAKIRRASYRAKYSA